MVTTFRAPANTYLQSDGGTISTAEHMDVVSQWVKALEPWQTPLLDLAMSNDEIEQEVHQWGQSFRIGFESTLASAVASAGATTITVDTNDGNLFQVGAILELYEVLPNTDIPDQSTYEQVRVTGINGDVLTVVRGHGGSTARASHAADDTIVRFLSTSEPLNSEHTEAPRVRGVRFFNYPQRFQAKLTADKRTQAMPTHEHPSNAFLNDFADETVKQKILLERQMFRGLRQKGVGNTVPSTFGGIDYFLTSNVVNLSGADLSFNDLDAVLSDLWANYESADKVKIVCSMNTARILDTTIDPIRRSEFRSDDTVSRVVRQYGFRAGTFSVEPTRNVPDGVIYLLDFNNIKVRPFKGLNWHVSEKKGQDHAVDHDVKAISGDFTLEVLAEHSMAKIYNFNGDLDDYITTTP